MGTDAVALLRVKSRALLRERLKAAHLPASCIEPLDDGTALFSTLARFGKASAYELRVLLTCVFGDDLPKMHDDPRGILVFPDAIEPRGRTYDAVATEVGAAGLWLSSEPLSPAALEAHSAQQMSELSAILSGSTPQDDAAAHNLGLGSLNELAARITADLASVDLSVGCLLVQRTVAEVPAPATTTSFPGAEAVRSLGDGTLVVVSSTLVSSAPSIAMALGEGWAAGLSEHRDERGVLLFSEAALEAVQACENYAAAVSCASPGGTWLRPTTLDAFLAARAARSAAFLAAD